MTAAGPGAEAAAILYGALVQLRNGLFARGFLPSAAASLPVISVGNLTVGGTGKTPLVLAMGEWLLRAGVPVGVLTRGYGRSSRRSWVVPAGADPPPATAIGDEPWLLKRREPRLALGVDGNRRRAARALAPFLPGGVFLLDDGFQHRGLRRDLDVVVLAAGEELARSRLLPAGRWREPPAALARATYGVIIAGPGDSRWVEVRTDEVRGIVPRLPLAAAEAGIAGVRPLGDWIAPLAPPSTVPGPVALVAGIAKPERFDLGLRAVNLDVAARAWFPDHHVFVDSDRHRIAAVARGAAALITTEKDEPRLLAAFGAAFPDSLGVRVLVARLALRFLFGEEELERAVLRTARAERPI